jgi:hypothetical protein
VLDNYSHIAKNKPKYGQFIVMRDGLEEKVELLSNNVIEGIPNGRNLSNYLKKGDKKPKLFITKNGISND